MAFQAHATGENSSHEMMTSSSESPLSLAPPSTKHEEASVTTTGVVSSIVESARPSPSSLSSNSIQHAPTEKSHVLANELGGDGTKRGPLPLTHDIASRCPHLEECMFPRFLSLDCKQMDDFCMGFVEDNPNVKSLGRVYIEALHLREFLKNPQTIESEKKRSSIKIIGKRLREPKSLPLSKRSSSFLSNKKSTEEHEELFNLSQSYFGGLEGRRTWLRNAYQDTENIEDFKYQKTVPTSDELLEKSKVMLASFPDDTFLPARAILPKSPEGRTKLLSASTLPFSNSSESGGIHQTNEIFHASSEVPPVRSDTSTSPATPEISNESLPKLDDLEENEIVSPDTHFVDMDSHAMNLSQRFKSNFECALREGKAAALKANQLLNSFRCNRRKYWANKLVKNGKAPQCLWCPHIDSRSEFQFGVIKDNEATSTSLHLDVISGMHYGSYGDALIQCLECDLAGCAPMLLNKESIDCHQHALLHFLMSGHRFGVTCGPLGEIFCMGCGDMVHHECFDQERERVFLEQNIPQLSWRETPIIRGIDPSSFIVAENQIMWQGMIASYPTPVSAQFVQASQLAVKRIAIFRGEICNGLKHLGPKAMELFNHQQCHVRGKWLPIGIYNLGNTCSMSATLQCLIHCKPLQELFLRDLAHPYQSCNVLRLKSGKSSCLTCEMDKALLEYFGSAVGIDTISALEELSDSSSSATITRAIEQPPDIRGLPLIPSRLLAECWRNRGMKNVAGHAQHDAQEFFDAFVDCLAHHALAFQKCAEDMRQVVHASPLHTKYPKSDTDFIKNIFTGTLKSVLMCQQCGCKRTQSESFSNVSLPLAKEFLSSHSESKNIPRHGKISVDICLDHFTLPETLSDPVFCVSCNEKTVTMKQHTFSKLPEVLCLHLKRFNAVANKKITDFVAFPAHDFDMGKHLTHWREWGVGVAENKSEDQCASNPQIFYDLFATVNHRGTLHQGHYTAYVKCGDSWYLCNDAFVTNAGVGDGEKEVLSSEGAYMLFYQKKKQF